jgi:hypothetical protein
MNLLIKWTWVFAILIAAMNSSYASYSVAAKGRVTGPAIHTTYFLSPNNQPFDVRAQAYMGSWINGVCQQNTALFSLGTERLQTGDFIDIDAFELKSVMGGGYSCMTIFYTYQQIVNESFQLTWDGFNYTATTPMQDEITIL